MTGTAVSLHRKGGSINPGIPKGFMNWKKVMREEIRELENHLEWIREETDKRVDAVVGVGLERITTKRPFSSLIWGNDGVQRLHGQHKRAY